MVKGKGIGKSRDIRLLGSGLGEKVEGMKGVNGINGIKGLKRVKGLKGRVVRSINLKL